MKRWLLTLLAADRPGLIAAVSGALWEAGANLREARFDRFGEGAELTAVVELPEAADAAALEARLRGLPTLAGAELRLEPWPYAGDPAGPARATHHLRFEGRDQPGLVARLTEVVADYGGNILRLQAQTLPAEEGERFLLDLWVQLPPARAESCLAALVNTAAALGMQAVAQAAVEA